MEGIVRPEAPSRRTASRRTKFQATPEAVARLLLLVDGFSGSGRAALTSLEGRTKLAKLDFFLRYPNRLARVVSTLGVAEEQVGPVTADSAPIEEAMIRYRYGPWDPAYFAILGNLIGRGLVRTVPLAGRRGVGYKTTDSGRELANLLRADEAWEEMSSRVAFLKRHLDRSGEQLKRLMYETFPDIAGQEWREEVQ